MECIFCKIANKEVKSNLVYEDEQVVAFTDMDPKAPQHVLIIPRQHFSTLNDIEEKDEPLLGHMLAIAKKIAKNLQIEKNGYRLVMNCNRDGGQAVFHIHLHLLGGRQLHWPPG